MCFKIHTLPDACIVTNTVQFRVTFGKNSSTFMTLALGYNGVEARPKGGGWMKSLAGRPRQIVQNITE